MEDRIRRCRWSCSLYGERCIDEYAYKVANNL